MGGTGVIDNFLGIFTSYIDSGFGLLGGEVAFIATTLIVIDVTLAALFWAWGADDDIIARIVKKTLFVGVFAYIISNWNNLARIVFESFAGLGLLASPDLPRRVARERGDVDACDRMGLSRSPGKPAYHRAGRSDHPGRIRAQLSLRPHRRQPALAANHGV